MVEQQEERDREREQLQEEDDRDISEDKGQVEPKLTYPGKLMYYVNVIVS